MSPAKPVSPTPPALLKARKTPDLVEVPARKVLSRTGSGGPEEAAFSDAVGALYGVAYTLKFARKKAGLPINKVGALEGEWSAEGQDLPLHGVPARETWRWQVRLAVPDDTTEAEVTAAIEAVTTKKRGKLFDSEEARQVRLEALTPARFARILHVGPFADEPASFARINTLLEARGLRRELWHVEVYLSDPSRTPQARMKTALLAPLVGESG